MKRLALLLCAGWMAPLGLLFTLGEPPSQKAGSASPPQSADSLALVFSGEMEGYLTPCGCSKPMLGGLPRRAGYLRSLSSKVATVRVENGDLTEAKGRQDELKAETVIEMLNTLKYDAITVGEKDFRLGVPYLQALQDRFKGAFLCANARKADGTPLFQEFVAVRRQIAGKPVRVVLVGALSDQFADPVQTANPDVRIESPAATLERLQPRIVAQGEVRVLLYQGPKAEAEELARRSGVFQMVVYAHEGDHPVEIQRMGGSALACSGQDGKYMGCATITPDGGWRVANVKYTALDPGFAEDKTVTQLKRTYLDRVAAEDLLSLVPKTPTANGDTFAGSAACAGCHAKAHRLWKSSAHAKAMQTLVNENEHRDPECVVCHSVGLDRVGGFINREKTPLLQDVGCESCHGPAARHTQNPSTSLPKAGSASCLACHIPQHSPNFDFTKYWEKIKHGKEP